MSVTPGPTASTTPTASEPRPLGSGMRIAPGAEIDVDEVHRDIGVAHARLAGAGLADLDGLELQHFGAAGFVEADGLGHELFLAESFTMRRQRTCSEFR